MKPLARTIMVQGTASAVGKSTVVAGLCRLLRQDGWSVAPFKSQNMALNAAVTADGLEIGRSQAVQAAAAGLPPAVEMNPILLKPEGEGRCQLVVSGRAVGRLGGGGYDDLRPTLAPVIAASLRTLRERHEVVVIEGAGSPAEINLKDRDLANMHVARVADAPVLLVGDIDRGGVFAAFVGTLALLDANERARVRGFVINKFRGEVARLEPGLRMLKERTGVPVLGVVPHVRNLGLADEDAVALEERRNGRRAGRDELDVVVIRTPRISNFDELGPLEREPGVTVRYVESAAELEGADLVVLPGSKGTVADLRWLESRGLAARLRARAALGAPILGICGGFQMLGHEIVDPEGIESDHPHMRGLGLLPVRTSFARDKITAQVRVRARVASWLTPDVDRLATAPIDGYEIHMGVVEPIGTVGQPFEVETRNGSALGSLDGAISGDGVVIGTLVHGLLENDAVRAGLLRELARRKGLAAPGSAPALDVYDRLADELRSALDVRLLYAIIGLDAPAAGRSPARFRNPASS